MGKSQSRRRSGWLHTVLQIGSIAAIGLATRASFADHYTVPSGSMEPTVHIGDHILVNKLAYGLRVPLTEHYIAKFGMPARGDVVVLTTEESPTVLLKRVVAVGGDLVEVRDGHVYLDGKETIEPTIRLSPELGGSSGGPDLGPVRVPPHEILVLGDNRGNSNDGRMFGFIERDQVIGHAVAIIARDGVPTYESL
jgi:signal peptidase I